MYKIIQSSPETNAGFSECFEKTNKTVEDARKCLIECTAIEKDQRSPLSYANYVFISEKYLCLWFGASWELKGSIYSLPEEQDGLPRTNLLKGMVEIYKDKNFEIFEAKPKHRHDDHIWLSEDNEICVSDFFFEYCKKFDHTGVEFVKT